MHGSRIATARAALSLTVVAALLAGATPACSVVGGIAGGLAGGDSSCDRRYGESDSPQPFCQEILDTVAGSRFREDCDQKLKGKSGEDVCPREHVIAGCKVNKKNDDGSEVVDWFYDVDADNPPSKVKPSDRIHTKEQVKAKCNEPGRYEEGATYQEP